jgi:hypothetical protein
MKTAKFYVLTFANLGRESADEPTAYFGGLHDSIEEAELEVQAENYEPFKRVETPSQTIWLDSAGDIYAWVDETEIRIVV